MKSKSAWNWQTHHSLVIFLIVLPWLLASAPVWQFSHDTFIVPLAPDLFDLSFTLLADQRILLPTWLIHPLLITYAFIGPALLGLVYLLTRRAFREMSWGAYLSLVVVLMLYSSAAPGTLPNQLLELSFLGLCLNPLLVPARPLTLWLDAALVLVVAQLTKQNEFLIFWITLSMSVGYLIHFILAQKTILPKKLRDHFITTSFTAFGLSCLAISVLFISLKATLSQNMILVMPDHWWLAWILGVLSVALCWLRPWETHRWLCLAILGHGIFFSGSLETAIWICIAWTLIQIINSLPPYAWFQKISPKKIKPWMATTFCFLFFFSGAIYQIFHFHPIRKFRTGWVSLSKELKATPQDGFLVIGEGTSFLAHFSPANFTEDPTALELSSEEELAQKLKNENLNAIIVDRRFVNDYWKRWIKEGREADTTNYSILTRLIIDGGKEVKLATLKLKAVTYFKVTRYEASDFFLIQPTAGESTLKSE